MNKAILGIVILLSSMTMTCMEEDQRLRFNNLVSSLETIHTAKFEETVSKSPSLLEVADESGKTLLMYVTRLGHSKKIKILLEAGAKVDVVDGEGKTALHHAMQTRTIDSHTVHKLMRNANPKIQDEKGDTPLHYLRKIEDDEAGFRMVKIVRCLLLSHREDRSEYCDYSLLTIKNRSQETPLDIAFRIRNISAISLFFEYVTYNSDADDRWRAQNKEIRDEITDKIRAYFKANLDGLIYCCAHSLKGWDLTEKRFNNEWEQKEELRARLALQQKT